MNNIYKLTLRRWLALLALLLPLAISARDFEYTYEGQTLTYTVLDEDAKTCQTKAGSSGGPGNNVSGRLILPSTVFDGSNQYTLTSIDSYAFYGCTELTSVTIPNSVTTIGDLAFEKCTGLTLLTIGNSVTEIGDYAFRNCSGLTSLTIPNSVTEIGSEAFRCCSGLSEVIIGNSVETIGDLAFEKCTGLTSITIPNSVTSIGHSAFHDCNGLTDVIFNAENCTFWGSSWSPIFPYYIKSVIFGESVKTIPVNAFYNCSNLTSVTIPNSVTSIGGNAFENCTGLTEVVIGNSVTFIGNSAFYRCIGLIKSAYPNNLSNPFSAGTAIAYNPEGAIIEDGFVFGPDKKSILFASCNLEGEYVIPKSVESIASSAFSYCSSLTSLTIPNSVTSIGNQAFKNCGGLKDLIFEDGDQTLALGYNLYKSTSTGEGLFNDCPLETLYLGRNLSYGTSKSYGYSPFNNKKTLKTVTITNSVTAIGNYAFRNCSGLIKSAYPNNLSNPFSYGTIIAYNPEGAIIEDGFIFGPDKKSIYFAPLNLEGEYVIPESVESIGDKAFCDCSGLTSVTIPNSVTSIGGSAFYNCSGLTSLTIPNSVTTIGNHAFYGCSGLSNIENVNPVPPSISSSSFSGLYDSAIVTVPAGSIGQYVSSNWVLFKYLRQKGSDAPIEIGTANDGTLNYYLIPATAEGEKNTAIVKPGNYSGEIIIPERFTVTDDDGNNTRYYVIGIGQGAFKNSSITKVTFNSRIDLKIIGAEAFSGCTQLTEFTIPTMVETIGESAFYGCNGLKGDFNIPNSVNSIGSSAFYGCHGLTSVSIPNSVAKIESSTFYNCTGLTSVAIPNSVTAIGNSAFYGCSGLTSLSIPGSVTEIGNEAFYGCSGIGNVRIEDGETPLSVGNAFSSCPIETVYLGRNFCGQSSPFKSKNTIKEVTIGNSVTEISDSAFYECRSLKSLTIGETVTSIGSRAFDGCRNLTSLNIPNSVTSIGSYAFSWCVGLKSVIIPNSVTEIGREAFRYCYNLTEVTIGNSVTFIGDSAFYNCSRLPSVTIPNSVTEIGTSAFSSCSGLTEVSIGDSVTAIGSEAFAGCTRLSSIVIGKSVTYIGSDAFKDCGSLTKAEFSSIEHLCSIGFENSAANPLANTRRLYIAGKEVTDLVIPNSVVTIGDYAFYNCDGLTSVTISDSVTAIGENAFSGCGALTKAEFASIEALCAMIFGSVDANPLSYAHHLYVAGQEVTKLVIPNSVIAIGDYAFSGCNGLTSVNIPNSVAEISKSAFSSCTSLVDITIEQGSTSLECGEPMSSLSIFPNWTSTNHSDSSTSYKEYTFSVVAGDVLTFNYAVDSEANYDKFIVKINNTTVLTESGNKSGSYRKEFTADANVTLYLSYTKDSSDSRGADMVSVTNIMVGKGSLSSLFADCPIETLYLGRNLNYAISPFLNKVSLTGLTISNSVTTIGESAFYGCTDLTSLTIPNSVIEIGDNAFFGCNNLTSLTIPNSVTEIGDNAFSGCSRLTSAYFADSAEAISIGDNAFSPQITNLYWGRPVEGMNLPTSNLESLTIGNVTAKIPDNAFQGVTSLKSLTMGSGLKEIGANAFSGCTGLTEIVVPIAVETIGASAFENNTSVKTIIMGAHVKNIGENAFKNCPATNVYVTAQTPPEAPNTAFSAYTAKLWLQDPGNDSVIDAYYDVFNCWDRFDGYAMVAATGINVDENPTVSLEPGQSVQLNATLEPENVALPQVYWRSTNPEVATVDANGVVTVHTLAENASSADCKIIAESLYADGPIAEIPVYAIKTVNVEEIRLSESELTLTVGQTFQLEAEVLPVDATDKRISWSSADPEIVSISNSGLLSAIAEGSTMITAATADGEISATCAVTVIMGTPEPVKPGEPLTLYRIHNKHHAGKYLTMDDDKMLIAADLDESNPQQLFRIEPAGDKVLLSAQGTYVAEANHTANIQNGTSDLEPGEFYMVRNGDEVAFDKEMPNGGTFANGSRALSVPNIDNGHVTTWATGTPYSWWYLEEVTSMTLTDLAYTNGNYYGNITMPFAFSTDAEVYTGLLNDNILDMTEIDHDFVEAGKPVIIRSASPEVTLNFLENVDEPSVQAADNHLSGNLFAADAPESAHAFCVLPDPERPAFAANSRAIGRNESYLDSSMANHNEVLLNIDGTVSIDELSVDGAIEVYDLRGVKVGDSTKGLPHGVYIVKTATKTTKVAI